MSYTFSKLILRMSILILLLALVPVAIIVVVLKEVLIPIFFEIFSEFDEVSIFFGCILLLILMVIFLVVWINIGEIYKKPLRRRGRPKYLGKDTLFFVPGHLYPIRLTKEDMKWAPKLRGDDDNDVIYLPPFPEKPQTSNLLLLTAGRDLSRVTCIFIIAAEPEIN